MRAPRREFLRRSAAAALALHPLAAAPLAGCAAPDDLPEGMARIKWDRDVCVRCGMVISDRRFAAQAAGGPGMRTYKFDDVGCAVFWLARQPWGGDPAVKLRVADASSGEWLDARGAAFASGIGSPMGYNFAAARQAVPGAVSYETMRQQVLARGK